MVEREQNTQIPEKKKISRREFCRRLLFVGTLTTGGHSFGKSLKVLYNGQKADALREGGKIAGQIFPRKKIDQLETIEQEIDKDKLNALLYGFGAFILGFTTLSLEHNKKTHEK